MDYSSPAVKIWTIAVQQLLRQVVQSGEAFSDKNGRLSDLSWQR